MSLGVSRNIHCQEMWTCLFMYTPRLEKKIYVGSIIGYEVIMGYSAEVVHIFLLHLKG